MDADFVAWPDPATVLISASGLVSTILRKSY